VNAAQTVRLNPAAAAATGSSPSRSEHKVADQVRRTVIHEIAELAHLRVSRRTWEVESETPGIGAMASLPVACVRPWRMAARQGMPAGRCRIG
jgi:hypothetical protein